MKPFECIVCVGQATWEGDFQKAIVQLMTELAARHRILYVDYQYTIKDLLMGLLGRRADVPVRVLLGQAEPLSRKTVAGGHEVYVWQPPLMLPVNFLPPQLHDWFARKNATRLVQALRPVMAKLNMGNSLVINGLNPVFGLPMLHELNEVGTVYYCFDEITKSAWMKQHGPRFERPYLQQVTAVITTSETLRQAKQATQPNTFCVKNGVNFDLFNQARQLAKITPPAAPVVGYLGTADNRLDLPLLLHCAKTLPDLTFQFIGEVHEPALTAQLSALPNVHFLPPHQPADLPALMAGWSVGMIPFVCNDHTYTIYPLKINEYLAAGLAVVATRFSLLTDFDGIIEVADTPPKFVLALRRALADHSETRINARINVARQNSWAHRAVEFEKLVARG
jgi:glycosyltransferase involved in cell wall biosynthesis